MTTLQHLLLGAAALALAAGPAQAQAPTTTETADPAPQTSVAAADAAVDDAEIVVTATGRAQSVQDIPIAVNVIGGEALANAGITDIRGIRQLTPSLQATTGQSAATGAVLSIRGIGTAGDNPGFEPAVGVFIDGVFRARAGVALAELPPIERVEVLRGPQGTLFGRNTSAGALSITTERPRFDLGGYAEGSYGNYDEVELKAGLTGPLTDTVALRADGGYHRRDGYIRDLNTDRRINDLDRYFARGQALLDRDDLTVRVIADYAETDENCCGAVNARAGATSPAVNLLAGLAGNVGLNAVGDRRRQAVSPNRDYLESTKEYGVSGEVNYDIGDLRLTSITAFRDWRARRNQDIDFSGLDRAYRDNYRTGLEDFTQEVRLQGDLFEGALDFLVGGFYLNETLTLTDTVRFGTQANNYVDALINGGSRSAALPTGFQLYGTLPGVPLFGQVLLATNPTLRTAALANPALFALFNSPLPGNPAGAGNQADDFRVNTDAYALFTHNIVDLTDRLSLTLGARYNHERKSIDASIDNNTPTCSFFLNPATAPYTSILQANVPAAILLGCNPAVNSEFNGRYEGKRDESAVTGTAKLAYKVTDDVLLYGGYDRGYKSGGYNLDQASFDTRLLGGDGPQIEDLEFRKETVDAYEIGVKSSFGRAFSVNLNGFYQDFKDYQSLFFSGTNFITENIPRIVSKGAEAEAVLRPTGDLAVQLGYTYLDATIKQANPGAGSSTVVGQQLNNQPKNIVTTALTWTPPLGPRVTGLFHVDMRFNSDHRPLNDPLGIPVTENDAYAIVNARIGATVNDRFSLEAYVENLFDTDYNITAFAVPEQPGTFANYPSPPRFYGVRARVTF